MYSTAASRLFGEYAMMLSALGAASDSARPDPPD